MGFPCGIPAQLQDLRHPAAPCPCERRWAVGYRSHLVRPGKGVLTMADNEKNQTNAEERPAGKTAAEASPGTAGVKPKEQPKHAYVLKEGASINTIENGEHVTRAGDADGNVTIELTEEQAKAFADKLDMKASGKPGHS